MKLIDLLVQELPKRGGWPKGAKYANQSAGDDEIYFFDGECTDGVFNNRDKMFGMYFDCKIVCSDQKYHHVSRGQYEAALAASKTPEWDGKWLPPVGSEFEYRTHRTKAKCIGIGCDMVFASKVDLDGDYEEFMISILDSEFHLPRSDNDNKIKRDAATEAMNIEWRKVAGKLDRNGNIIGIYDAIYSAVSAGKIPGVKLED